MLQALVLVLVLVLLVLVLLVVTPGLLLLATLPMQELSAHLLLALVQGSQYLARALQARMEEQRLLLLLQ